MIILLSPSKTINPKPVAADIVATVPKFASEALELVGAVNKLGKKLATTLGVSDKLAEENRKRFAGWRVDASRPDGAMAAWAYRGETFFGLSIEKLDDESRNFAQSHLYIVTGLYGLLRPQDTLMPYRLEMGTRLKGKWGKNLYEFWSEKLAKEIAQKKPGFVLNCASVEYSKAALNGLPKDIKVITPKFLSPSPSGLKTKMVFAKYSRGLMARWAIESRVEKPEELKDFDVEGYVYDAKLSSENECVFIAPAAFSIKGRFTKL